MHGLGSDAMNLVDSHLQTLGLDLHHSVLDPLSDLLYPGFYAIPFFRFRPRRSLEGRGQ